MKSLPRQRIYLFLAAVFFCLHLGVAAVARPSFGRTMFGDGLSCLLIILAFLAVRENFRLASGLLPLFWKLFAAGLVSMLLSQGYWFYFDSSRRFGAPSPVLGGSLFLLAHVFFLFALALRPHSASAGRDLRARSLDFALLALWWFALYGYFSLPWQFVLFDYPKYDSAYFLLALIQHLVIVVSSAVLWRRSRGPWRRLYGYMSIAFTFIASGELLLSVAIDRGFYNPGGFFDTQFLLSLLGLNFIAGLGSSLQPSEDARPGRELQQIRWTARIAMVAILSLPLIALLGRFEKNVPAGVAAFRLRLVFGAMFILGGLVYWKLNLLTHELIQFVRLTQESIENLKSVQQQVAHSEKLTALGRLAAGATHEISNPLTAILGYSELLADIPALSPEDRDNAKTIQQQVHHAQAAVNSLRNTLRRPSPPPPITADKPSTT